MTSAPVRCAGFTASLLLAAGAVIAASVAQAQPWSIGVAPYQRQPWGYQPSPYRPNPYPVSPYVQPSPHSRLPVASPLDPWAYGDLVSDGDPLDDPGPSASQLPTPAQLAQRCNTGRLVGGLLGGGLGYGLSRQDGRAWAVPLGALLGSQMGCSAAVGNGLRPW